MILALAVLTTAAVARAELSYKGGITMKGPLSACEYSEYSPAPLYNHLSAPNPGKYQYQGPQTFSDVQVNQPPLCSCGCQNSLGPPLAGPPQLLPIGPPPQFVYPPEYPGPSAFSPQLNPPIPPAPDPVEKQSHIMKIPRRSDSSIMITVNPPGPSSNSNTVYSPNSLSVTPRPVFLRPPPLLTPYPATVFYPATPGYPIYPPPFTCPLHPPYQPPPNFPPQPSQQFTSSPVPTTVPNGDRKTIASFTSTIPDSRFFNATMSPEKRDPLLTFKLLSKSASKHPTTPPSPSLEAEAASRDCSMPIPPQIV